MRIDEFIKEVNRVAYAVYSKEYDQLDIYVDEDGVDDGTWFLRLVSHSQDVIWGTDWSCLDGMGVGRLAKVMELFDKLQHTPVDARFPEKKYVLVAHPDSKRDFMTDALKYVSLIESTEDEFAFHYGPATIFSEDSLAAVAKAHPFIKPAIDAMKKEVH